jgi:NO-binding membrane sensor protein with MHYT domain
METRFERTLILLSFLIAAVIAALSLDLIARSELGLSRHEIRAFAAIGAVVIAVLVAVDFFGKKLAKPK